MDHMVTLEGQMGDKLVYKMTRLQMKHIGATSDVGLIQMLVMHYKSPRMGSCHRPLNRDIPLLLLVQVPTSF